MTRSSSDSIRNSVIGGVFTAVIVGALTAVWAWMPGVWAWLSRIVTVGYSHLAGRASVPVWSLYLAYGAIGLWAIALGMHLYSSWSDNEPKPTDYKTDSLFGVVWRWKYPEGKIGEPWAYCPTCDTTLVYSEKLEIDTWRTHFICETCQRECLDAEGMKSYVVSKVVRQIDRKLRSGEWKKVVQENSTV